MKRGLVCVAFAALFAMISGCATSGRSNYSYAPPSTKVTPTSEILVDEPFDAVWDRLVGRLATGFFVINNIDKASRLINVSYSSDSPGDFVDCGRSTRQFAFKDEAQTYTYAVADSSTFKTAGTWGPMKNLAVVGEISRRPSVEGRINLYVAPVSPTATKVTANVKYVFKVTVGGLSTAYNAFGGVVNQAPIPQNTSDISFSTAEGGAKEWGMPPNVETIRCQSTGKLEQSLLEKAKP